MDYVQLIYQLERICQMCSEEENIKAITEAIDIIADYEKATAQTAELTLRYEMPERAIKRQAGLYICPSCGKRTQSGHTHCHWCGKKLIWNRHAICRQHPPYSGSRKKERNDENGRKAKSRTEDRSET